MDGKPHLVDLHEPADEEVIARNGANNQYWLFTRQNPTNAQILVNGNANSVANSNYRANRGLKVIVHGWNSNGNSAMNPQITSAFLAVQDVNVIVVDWRALANSNYITATNGVPGVGQFLGNFLVWLINTAGGNCSHGIPDIIDDSLRQFPGWNIVHFQVGCGIDEGLINGVGIDILRCKVLQKYAMDLCSAINVELHPGRGNDILDIAGYIPDPTTVLDA